MSKDFFDILSEIPRSFGIGKVVMQSAGDESPQSPDEFSLAPADGMSENERTFRARFYPPVDEPIPTSSKWQFSIRDILLGPVDSHA